MIKLNVNQEKQLTFEVQIGGVQSDQISSHLRVVIDDIEYGFPAEVGNESITVNLPALRTVIAKKLNEGQEVEVKLEVIADGTYLTPWSDTFSISNPLMVEAKIVSDASEKKLKTKLVQEEKVVKKEKHEPVFNEEDLTERIVNKLAEKLTNINKHDKVKTINESKKPAKKIVKENIVVKPISRKQLLSLKEEDVYAYMERAGTKNAQIQKIIYDQAESKAQSSRPVNVLMEVVKILKRKE